MANYDTFSFYVFAIIPLAFLAIVLIVKQCSQQKRLIECRRNFVAKRKIKSSKAENGFFVELRITEQKSKLRQHNEGISPYSIWWWLLSFKIKDFSATCKMTTTKKGLR